MNTLRLKRGDALVLAGTILNPPRPAGGWTGYTLRAEAMALDSQGEPTGAVIGQFACDWPDRDADAVTLRLETAGAAFANLETFGFDIALVAPDGTTITTLENTRVHLLDRISTAGNSANVQT